ncbi:hypothetical protein NCAS_0G02590 [Naumovozyma castellii]|uniref:YNL108C n=1 Tax=Naumovozyma castellii TaxID=27288 RepID=Q875T0_NAUCA|nr:hypothetical protein NCAS_0G02590 [Naumovozyma castellii CBS 4309]AAO32552.1 YNL108C [Naumovozyma castellii]CCC71146.1 hypothetical protein NCAS_0G02590 [Naumovozyma castellii CBS 4309]
MALQTIYVVRHGFRSNWVTQGPYPDPPLGIENDVPLAEHGLDQAKDVAKYIATFPEDKKPQLIISSPFYRCIQTSKPTAELLQLPLYLERGLGEWFVPERENIPVPAGIKDLEKFFPGLLSNGWDNCTVPSNKGETEDEILQRCYKFWAAFFKQVEEKFPNVTNVILFTHAATKAALGTSILGLKNVRDPIDDKGTIIRSGSCSMDRYERSHDDKHKWKMTMNGNASYLTNGEEMNWNFQKRFKAATDAEIKIRLAANEEIIKEKGAKAAATVLD